LPTSKRPERLVVDANAILAALLGGNARRVFFETAIVEFAVPASVIDEVKAYLPRLAERLDVSQPMLEFALDQLPLRVYARRMYAQAMSEARRRIERRDPDDVEVLALTLRLGVPLWSNDRDFEEARVERFTTGQLLRLFFGPSGR
jgi:predicted nucleic acid-binding protein